MSAYLSNGLPAVTPSSTLYLVNAIDEAAITELINRSGDVAVYTKVPTLNGIQYIFSNKFLHELRRQLSGVADRYLGIFSADGQELFDSFIAYQNGEQLDDEMMHVSAALDSWLTDELTGAPHFLGTNSKCTRTLINLGDK